MDWAKPGCLLECFHREKNSWVHWLAGGLRRAICADRLARLSVWQWMLPLVVESGFLLHETLEKLGIVRLEWEQNPG